MQTETWITISICFTFMFNISFVSADLSDAYKVERLPDQPTGNVTFQQYAGYIYVDTAKTRALFFYFVEAETEPESKPLLLRLDGGPGCSGVGFGVFIEHGPFKPKGDVLIKNDYSWNKVANVLYLEAPVGVGFSYSTNESDYAYLNDEMTARDSLEFLNQWFVVFDKYKDYDLHIAGESYGGHFAPQLAKLVVENKPSYKLKGVVLGNPLLEFSSDLNSKDTFYWSHGLISDAIYGLTQTVCNNSQYFRESQAGNITDACNTTYNLVVQQISASLNVFDVTADICLSSATSQSELSTQEKVGPYVDPCASETTTRYLNREDVKNALHAKLIGVSSWSLCSTVIAYDERDTQIPIVGILGFLVESGKRLLVYSGDQDAVLPFISTRTLIDKLAAELKLETSIAYRVWFEGNQVAGWTQGYGEDDKIIFATIRDGNHQTPYNQPARSFTLIKAYFEEKPLPHQKSNLKFKSMNNKLC